MRRRKLKTEIAIATLDCARADLEYEIDRTRSLDSKLTGIASLSGLALSIGAGVGASIVAGGELSLGFTIALGSVLSVASLFLLAAAVVALLGLTPKVFQTLSLEAGRARVSDERLSGDAADAIGELAATYYIGGDETETSERGGGSKGRIFAAQGDPRPGDETTPIRESPLGPPVRV